jgi:lipid A 3-O-deacylase
MTPSSIKALLALALACAATCASAVDSVALEYGTGNRTDIVRLSAQWDWQKPLWQSASSELRGHWDANLTHWHGSRFNNVVGASQDFVSAGITPVVRWQGANSKTGLYGEAGLGVHWFSSLYNNNGSQLSTHYQFGTLLGTGYRFSNKFDLGLRIQHFSNGGFKQPNTGVNLAIVRAAYRF